MIGGRGSVVRELAAQERGPEFGSWQLPVLYFFYMYFNRLIVSNLSPTSNHNHNQHYLTCPQIQHIIPSQLEKLLVHPPTSLIPRPVQKSMDLGTRLPTYIKAVHRLRLTLIQTLT